jgi:hypothetical protein
MAIPENRVLGKSFAQTVSMALLAAVLGMAAVLLDVRWLLIVAGAVIAVVVVFASIYQGLLLILALVPFSNYVGSYVQVPGLSVGGVVRDVIVYLVILAWVTRRLVLRKSLKVRMSLARWCALGFMVLSGLYLPFGDDLLTAVFGFRNTALFILLLFVTEDLVQTRQQLKQVLGVMLAVACILAAIGVAESATGGAFLRLLGWNLDYSGIGGEINQWLLGHARATAGMGNATDFGVFETMACLMVVTWWTGRRANWWHQRWRLALVALTGAAVVASLARTAWLATAVGIVTVGVLLKKRRLVRLVVMIGLVLVIAYQFSSHSIYFQRLLSRDVSSRATTAGRLEIYKSSISFIAAHPFGVGLGTQGSANRDPNSAVRITLDSYFLQLAVEGGVLLLGAYLVLLGGLVYEAARIHRKIRDPLLKSTSAGIVAVLAAVVVANITSASLDSRTISIYFWVLIGVLYSLPRLDLVSGGT